jgi:hypothetical protein
MTYIREGIAGTCTGLSQENLGAARMLVHLFIVKPFAIPVQHIALWGVSDITPCGLLREQ